MYENYLYSCLVEFILIFVVGSNYKCCVFFIKDLCCKFFFLFCFVVFEIFFVVCYCLFVRFINNSEVEIDFIKIDMRR